MRSGMIRRLPVEDGATGVVQAAGGVLLRRPSRRRVEVAVVHRPGREDWSLPKGKQSADETLEQCARREVFEETGYRCVLGDFVGTTEYVDRRGRPKVVSYWLMEPAKGVRFDRPALLACDEVDELRWLELAEARRILSYERDRELLDQVDHRRLARLG